MKNIKTAKLFCYGLMNECDSFYTERGAYSYAECHIEEDINKMVAFRKRKGGT
jgi:hypothetical protein